MEQLEHPRADFGKKAIAFVPFLFYSAPWRCGAEKETSVHPAFTDDLTTQYDAGYASIDPNAVIGANQAALSPLTPAWGAASLRLHITWLTTQLQADPRNSFKHGRCDALCDLLARIEPLAN